MDLARLLACSALLCIAITFPQVGIAADGTASREPIKKVKVAGIVLKWVRGDKAANFRRAEPLIREAARNGAELICTTECFLDGYSIADKSIPLDEYRRLGEPIPDGPWFQKLAALSAELKVHLIAGMLEADGERRFNTAVLIGPDGKLIGKYRKQKLGHELPRNTPGTESPVFPTRFGKLGLMICADRTDPEIVRKIAADADFLICPSGGMYGPKRNDHILQARSKENSRSIIFVHPAEFLVTAPDGSVTETTVIGKTLLVKPEEVGKSADESRVFYFDLPSRASSKSPGA